MNFSTNFVCECKEKSTYNQHVAAPLFRKEITISERVQCAEILICGLGFYDLFINGERITKGKLAPYISNPDHIIYYDYYNLLPYLQSGKNVIGVMLGDGFQNAKTPIWDFKDNVFNSSPKLALECRIIDENGEVVFDARTFRCKKGPIVFNDLRSGVFYDKRLEEIGWNKIGFQEDDTWHIPYLAERPRGEAKKCEAEPIIIKKELHPINIYKGELDCYEPREEVQELLKQNKAQEEPTQKSGGWVYDFGENNAGIFRLKIKGKKGQRVDIQCAERIKDGKLNYQDLNFYPDGYVQRDIYILGSDEEEIFEPMFTYHGYRYLYVSGITEEQATEELLTYLVMSSNLEKRGNFICSNAIANKIYEIACRSDSANFYYFPTDCPHREKNGWTGDAAVSAEHMILTMGAENSWREWLNNIRCAQNEFGMLPGIVPTGHWGYEWGNGPAWDTVLFTIPYIIYRYRGETDVILENAHAMLRYLEYISKQRNSRGLLEIGLGDWLPVDRPAAMYEVPLEFTDSVMTYDMCRMAVEMFETVGLTLHRNYAEMLGTELLTSIRHEYLETDTMMIKSHCQSAQAMGIYYNIFDECQKPEAFQKLLAIIHDKGDKVDTGFLGLRVIFHVLSQYGETQLAWEMITREEYPSYGWYAQNGYTTLPEQFIKDESGSHNHHFLGDVIQWFMRYPAGLQIENYKEIKIKPVFLKELDYASASHTLPSGEVYVSWRRECEKIIMEVSCPTEIQCRIEIEDGYYVKQNPGNIFECIDEKVCLEIFQ